MPECRILRDECVEFVHVRRVHAGGRLVEQQKSRRARQRARDLQPTLIDQGQLRRQPRLPVADARPTASISSALGARRALRCWPRQRRRSQRCRQQAAHAGVAADHHVLDHRQARKQTHLLEVAGDAHGEHLVGARPV